MPFRRHERSHDLGPAPGSSKVMLLVMLVIVVGGIAAFLILRPNPSGAPSQSPAAPNSQRQ